ncbi:hypothetical protein [Carboxylicivirga sp. N1Y90]|uniref:hypothetical protein n=1 Tax=Carboxylicivirga fragile TaxID=3417571 RepID=UPI003D358BAF|nr:hypothetical protein [Marinilabiliaceae bacterium N1Y90]
MLNFSDYFDEKKCYAASLIKLAQADGELLTSENMWLNFVTISLGISPQELKEINENLEKFSFQTPKTERERFFMFFRMVQLMKVDLKIDEKELKLCKDLGARLYINTNKVDKALEFVKEHERSLIKFEDVEAILK